MPQLGALAMDLVRGAAVPVTLVFLTSCASLAPVEELPAGAEPMTPPASYLAWWGETEACADLQGDFDRVEFYVVPGVRSFSTDVGEKVGLWVRSGSRRQIIVAGEFAGHEMVVRHEMLHDLLAREGHPDTYFTERCGLTWETWQDGGEAYALAHAH